MTKSQGLTLVEVLIAMVILLLVSLALMQTALVSIDANMRNVLRDEAVSVAEMRMDEARNIPFDNLVDDTADAIADDGLVLTACQNPPVSDPNSYPVRIDRSIRNITAVPFGTRRIVTTLDTDNMQITILIRWVYRNECFSHTISTIVRRQ
jgi:prepilin-type N-terminal cleavage/methylation domain-containing protein